jgi:hypothetical protein
MSEANEFSWAEEPWFLNDPDESGEPVSGEVEFLIPVEWLFELPSVIDSAPPVPVPSRRVGRKSWETRLSQTRARQGEWVRVVEPMTKPTASQIASDIRRSHERDPGTIRVNGILPGEKWEAVYRNDPIDPDDSHFYVWLRWLGNGAASAPGMPDRAW